MDKLNQDSVPARLKGVGDSLWVTLDPTQPIDRLKDELNELFKRLNHLAVNARIVIDTGKPSGCDNLIESLGRYLKDTFQVGSVSGPPRKRSHKEEHTRKRDMVRSWQHYRSDVLMLTGRVRSGQKVTARKHLVLMGDVNPGAEIVAGGDILVIGSLCGTAVAGQPDNDQAIVLALDFRPTQLQIGGFMAAGLPPSGTRTTEFAHVENGTIVVEDYLEANPFKRLQWPEAR